ncbi:hypothetical protein HK097_000922 [Rhizophlyctis rosea]|uniref:Uncharacterized protein n=1 Tax=Rhizophlyctis rosea TaxID=64517 RepID=A0AAD5SJ92_9FUNG|nr:hypothetical protein HK097_000922 [Rhizophlyctis rosea]
MLASTIPNRLTNPFNPMPLTRPEPAYFNKQGAQYTEDPFFKPDIYRRTVIGEESDAIKRLTKLTNLGNRTLRDVVNSASKALAASEIAHCKDQAAYILDQVTTAAIEIGGRHARLDLAKEMLFGAVIGGREETAAEAAVRAKANARRQVSDAA